MTESLRVSILAVFIATLFLGGCRRTSSPPSASPPAPTASVAVDQLHHPEGGSVPAETRYFAGSIGNSLDLEMKLVKSGDQLTGSYTYRKVGTKIDLKGSVDKDGRLTLQEFDPKGKQTGVFTGLWNADQDGSVSLVGNWSKPNDKSSDRRTAFAIHQLPIKFCGEVEVVTKNIKENNKQLRYEIDARYPQLSVNAGAVATSPQSNPNFEKFNQAAKGLVLKKVADFKKDMVAPEEQGDSSAESAGSSLDVSYVVELAQDDLMSVSFGLSSYYQGAAHPNSYATTLNYDLRNGKLLKMSDLFKPGSRYLQTLSGFAITDLKKKSKANGNSLDESLIESGAGATAKNYERWSITTKGLKIEFDPYQVGPYASGSQEVVVPYSALKDMIAPESPLAQFAK